MPRKKPKNRKKGSGSRVLKHGYLDIQFGSAKDGHPEIYDFFLEQLPGILMAMGEPKAIISLVRLEPLNSMYSHLEVSNSVMQRIFLRYCKTHSLEAFSAFGPAKNFSARGKVRSQKLGKILDDYNLLFDLFFCDIRLEAKKVFIDAMDLFSNRLLVEANPKVLKQFQKLVKKSLPQTRFKKV